MTDISNIDMVSYYNSLAMYRQQQQTSTPQSISQQAQHQAQMQQAQQPGSVSGANGAQNYWYGYPHAHPPHTAHHQPTGSQQYLEHHTDVLPGWPPHPHVHPFQHLQYQHQAFQQQHHHQQQQPQPQPQQQQPQQPHQPHQPQQQQQRQQQPQQQQQQQQPQQRRNMPGVGEWRREDSSPAVGSSEPSPPITASCSDLSSPCTPSTSPANNANRTDTTAPMRPPQNRSPFEWMKKPSYQTQPNPGKTRTKDKYRVVYTDHQRLELEKEFHYSRYITIRRKSELAVNLSLSERQVKIWFQNRRAKERKQVKKQEEFNMDAKEVKEVAEALPVGMAALAQLGNMGGMMVGMETNPTSTPPLNLGASSHALTAALHQHPQQASQSLMGL